MRRACASLIAMLGLGALVPAASAKPAPVGATARRACPAEMAAVRGFCIDRWEASLIDRRSRRPLSPYYPPQPKALGRVREVWLVERERAGEPGARRMPLPEPPSVQLEGSYEPVAVSRPGTVPHGYLTYHAARNACQAAGKRLCSEAEWVTACRGRADTKFPYGAHYVAGRCNVFRALHPAAVLHGNASMGLTDPRLNLVVEAGKDPLLRATGASTGCTSAWDDGVVYDMVGNLDEWIDDPSGVFVGGFYARMTTKGCEAKVSGHAPSYYDYSTGTRCCADPTPR
ncbi:MAG: SUMF1/EgtB/PvdO family nonheme iron enzyme [Myxococcales bacterium]|nr:SUMF1/EgtB/PvdO family nonheme iron enzyme [Myxococcales bacterium]